MGSLIVAASMATVEALKDQVGLCRWDYALRALHRQAMAKAKRTTPFSRPAARVSSSIDRSIETRTSLALGVDEKASKSEESLRTVMYLSCWGPN